MAVEKNGILLESGTNEFEIVEFSVGGVHYGINVAKVREVIQSASFPVTKMAQAHPYLDGVITLRGSTIPLVNLPRCLGHGQGAQCRNIIVTEINAYFIGFLVESVSRIHRISWNDMESPPQVGGDSRVVGMVRFGDRIVLLMDFESIIAEVNPQINRKLTNVQSRQDNLQAMRESTPIVVAEDSMMLRNMVVGTLKDAGYGNVSAFVNGLEAWNYLHPENGPAPDMGHGAVITDIEMPKMDGHRLLKLIRDDEELRGLPVILFSSLINEEMRNKGEMLGATGQIAKPEMNELVDFLDSILLSV
ncbi:MAG: chemotaxis protein CheV [Schwartzia sp.]|nr:chemotaxis protein CheV [Schwartzia sp. (in: firmicutes)]MBR1886104.1 chemotaxis protein CheV [Schwartzia sp. (in: firmicutes)]